MKKNNITLNYNLITIQKQSNTIMTETQIVFIIHSSVCKQPWLESFNLGSLPSSFQPPVVFVFIHTDKPTAIELGKQSTFNDVYIIDYKRRTYNTCLQISTACRNFIIYHETYWEYFITSPDSQVFPIISNTPLLNDRLFIDDVFPYCLMTVNDLKNPSLQSSHDLTIDKYMKTLLKIMNTNGSSKSVCHADGCSNTVGLRTCGSCKMVKYCCKECQRADWKSHKELCTACTRLQTSRKKHAQSVSVDT